MSAPAWLPTRAELDAATARTAAAIADPSASRADVERAAELEEAASQRVVRMLRAEIDDPTIGRCRACGSRTAPWATLCDRCFMARGYRQGRR